MRTIVASLLLLAGALLPRSGFATPILIQLEGRIDRIEGATGLAKELDLALGGALDAAYRLDREAGVITFGDGRHGARLPTGGGVVAGTYRSGGGQEGTVEVFDDCWVQELTCVPNQGGDAYVVQLLGSSDAGIDYALLMELATTDRGVLDGELAVTLPPPALGLFDSARFRWLLTDGTRTSEISGDVVSLRRLSEPSTVALALLGLGFVAARRFRRI